MIELNKPYYYDNLCEDAYDLQRTYPQLITTTVIGTSHDHRNIFMLKLGNGDINVFLTSGVHGRESINPIVLMKMVDYYCKENYKLLRKYSFYFIPLVNPDGYMIALRGFDEIREEPLRSTALNKKIPYFNWKYNARGIDINRNFPSFYWKQKSETDYPASENETKALIHIFETIPSIGYIDYHSRGKAIYYHRGIMGEGYNNRQKVIAERLADELGYDLMPKEEEIDMGDTGGNTVHFYSESIGKPAITIETTEETEEFPLKISLQEETFHEILFSPFRMLF